MKIVHVTASLMTEVLTAGYVCNKYITVTKGLPEGCTMVDAKLLGDGTLEMRFREKDEYPLAIELYEQGKIDLK